MNLFHPDLVPVFSLITLFTCQDPKGREHAGQHQRLVAIAANLDAGRMASGSIDGKVSLWDIKSGKELASLSAHDGPVTSLAIGPSGESFYSAGTDGLVLEWTAGGLNKGRKWKGAGVAPDCMALSSDESYLAIGRVDGSLAIVDLKQGTLSHLTNLLDATLPVSFSTKDNLVAALTKDGKIVFWDARTTREIVSLTPHTHITRAALSPAWNTLIFTPTLPADSEEQRQLFIADLTRGQVVSRLGASTKHGKTATITSLAVSQTGRLFAMGHEDGRIVIMNSETGGLAETWESFTTPVRGLTFASPSGPVLSFSDDRVFRERTLAATAWMTSVSGIDDLAHALLDDRGRETPDDLQEIGPRALHLLRTIDSADLSAKATNRLKSTLKSLEAQLEAMRGDESMEEKLLTSIIPALGDEDALKRTDAQATMAKMDQRALPAFAKHIRTTKDIEVRNSLLQRFNELSPRRSIALEQLHACIGPLEVELASKREAMSELPPASDLYRTLADICAGLHNRLHEINSGTRSLVAEVTVEDILNSTPTRVNLADLPSQDSMSHILELTADQSRRLRMEFLRAGVSLIEHTLAISRFKGDVQLGIRQKLDTVGFVRAVRYVAAWDVEWLNRVRTLLTGEQTKILDGILDDIRLWRRFQDSRKGR